jgi:hypothetical protein
MKVSQYRRIGTLSAATKAAPCVLTLAAADRPVNGYVINGASILVSGSGFALLDGLYHTVSAVSAAAGTITLATSTAAEAGTLGAAGLVNMQNTLGGA